MLGQRIGYIRVSTVDQHVEWQLEGIEVDKTFLGKASGPEGMHPCTHERPTCYAIRRRGNLQGSFCQPLGDVLYGVHHRTGQSSMERMIRIAKAMIVKRLRASFCLPPSKDLNLTYNG